MTSSRSQYSIGANSDGATGDQNEYDVERAASSNSSER